MTIRRKNRSRKPVIDLTGPAGNAYALLGIAKDAFKDLGRAAEWPKICTEMMSGDYENLVQVFDRELGAYFILER